MVFKQGHIRKNGIRFRRFVKKGWAAFASMHREVTIGHVSAVVADISMQKMGEALQMLETEMWCGVTGTEEDDSSVEDERLTALVVSSQEAASAGSAYAFVTDVNTWFESISPKGEVDFLFIV